MTKIFGEKNMIDDYKVDFEVQMRKNAMEYPELFMQYCIVRSMDRNTQMMLNLHTNVNDLTTAINSLKGKLS